MPDYPAARTTLRTLRLERMSAAAETVTLRQLRLNRVLDEACGLLLEYGIDVSIPNPKTGFPSYVASHDGVRLILDAKPDGAVNAALSARRDAGEGAGGVYETGRRGPLCQLTWDPSLRRFYAHDGGCAVSLLVSRIVDALGVAESRSRQSEA